MSYELLKDISVGDYVTLTRGGTEEKAHVEEISYYAGTPIILLGTASRRFSIGCTLIVEGIKKVSKDGA